MRGVALFLLLLSTMAHAGDSLNQFSTIGALMAGEYEGDWTVDELTNYGNFGLGAVNRLQGELIVADGTFYVAVADGSLRQLELEEQMPFVMLTHFEAQAVTRLGPSSYVLMTSAAKTLAANKNLPLAVRIDGHFKKLLLRSERVQTKPYEPLATVMARDEVRYSARDITGSLIGFYMPAYFRGLSVPGFHFHFVSGDRNLGGHVIDAELTRGKLSVDPTPVFHLVLPDNSRFAGLVLDGQHDAALDVIEHQTPGSVQNK